MLLAFNLKHILITYQKKIPKGLSLALTLSRSTNTWGLYGCLCWQMLTPVLPCPPTQQQEWKLLQCTPTAPCTYTQCRCWSRCRAMYLSSSIPSHRWCSRTYTTAQCVFNSWKKEWTKERKKFSQGYQLSFNIFCVLEMASWILWPPGLWIWPGEPNDIFLASSVFTFHIELDLCPMFAYGVWTESSTSPVPLEANSHLGDFGKAATLDSRHDLHMWQSLQAAARAPNNGWWASMSDVLTVYLFHRQGTQTSAWKQFAQYTEDCPGKYENQGTPASSSRPTASCTRVGFSSELVHNPLLGKISLCLLMSPESLNLVTI